jgi:glycosyltransferase 2 family protein
VHPTTKFRPRFAAVNIGFMGNNLLPARIGEFMRVLSLSRLEPVPVVASFGSLVVERVLDAILVIGLLFLATGLPGFPGLGRPGTQDGVDFTAVAQGVGLFVAALIVVLFLVVLFPVPTTRVIDRIAVRVLPERGRRLVVDAVAAFLAGIGVLRDPRLLARALAWSAVLWLVNAVGFWLAFRAFGLELSFAAALFFQWCISLAVSAPSGPAFFGTYHAAARVVLVSLWGLPSAPAVAFATGFHLAGFIPVTLIGLWFAWSTDFSFRRAPELEDVVEEAIERAIRTGEVPPPPGLEDEGEGPRS